MFRTPILFLIFNRPDTTQQVFDAIKKQKPKYLYVAADGPRSNAPGEKEKCQAARDIIKQIDWDCELKTLFRGENLGCGKAVSSAITWFFENVEQGIILEDDCLPHPSFFRFCEELLEKYRVDERVMQIGGCNFQEGIHRGDGSYYFSKNIHIWGWATWRRAWHLYDFDMKNYNCFVSQRQIENIWPGKINQESWIKNFQSIVNGSMDTWDYQWMYAIWSQNGLSILPNINMISNIGFGDGATHTLFDDYRMNMKTYEMDEIVHPTFVLQNVEADNYPFKKHSYIPLHIRIFKTIKKLVKRNLKYFLKTVSQ